MIVIRAWRLLLGYDVCDGNVEVMKMLVFVDY